MGQYESITAEEKRVFMETWMAIRQDLHGYGNALFNTIFVNYSVVMNHFEFSGPDDDRFEQHTKRFMIEMDKWVNNLDKPRELKQLIAKLGMSHAKHNIRPDEFQQMRSCFIKAVISKLGEHHFGKKSQTIFDKFMSIAFDHIMATSDQARAKRAA